MSVDDILYSPVGLTQTLPDWRKVPIHLTFISPSGMTSVGWNGNPLAGIHYLYPETLLADDERRLKDEIHAMLGLCLNRDLPVKPLGYPVTLIQSIPRAQEQFTESQRFMMYDIGANPIGYMIGSGYGEILWEQKFMDLNRNVGDIVEMTGRGDLCINPKFVELTK